MPSYATLHHVAKKFHSQSVLTVVMWLLLTEELIIESINRCFVYQPAAADSRDYVTIQIILSLTISTSIQANKDLNKFNNAKFKGRYTFICNVTEWFMHCPSTLINT